MKAFKGFNKDMTCRGYKFEEGKTYEEKEAKLCTNGFHACEMPLDVLGYYLPATSEYHEVELEEVSYERGDDTKICGKRIKIGAKLSIRNLVDAQIEYINERTHKEEGGHATGKYGAASATGCYSAASATGYHGAASATGDYGSAIATNYGVAITTGYQGAASATGNYSAASATGDYGVASATGDHSAASATGDYGVASVTGDHSAASATGDYGVASVTGCRGVARATGYQSVASAIDSRSVASATGCQGAAIATGDYGKAIATGIGSVAIACGKGGFAKADKGNVIVLVERGDWHREWKTHKIISAKAAIVDGEIIKADTWYTLVDGKFVEVPDDVVYDN